MKTNFLPQFQYSPLDKVKSFSGSQLQSVYETATTPLTQQVQASSGGGGGKVWDAIFNGLSVVTQGANVYTAIKQGQQVQPAVLQPGQQAPTGNYPGYPGYPAQEPPKKDNTLLFVGGAVVVLVILFLALRSNKNVI